MEDLKNYIFRYLDKRHRIEDNVIYFKDIDPFKRIKLLFGIKDATVLCRWIENNVSDTYSLEYPNGLKLWYRNGKLHRDDGPALAYANGKKAWYQNGQKHREGGPAIIHPNGTEHWYLNGELHREDGPAIINPSGRKEWWINNVQIKNPHKIKKKNKKSFGILNFFYNFVMRLKN